eukprot:4963072-Ditylum_brightwellii.AAC.1
MTRWFKSALKKCLLDMIIKLCVKYYKGKQVQSTCTGNAPSSKRQRTGRRSGSFLFCTDSGGSEE